MLQAVEEQRAAGQLGEQIVAGPVLQPLHRAHPIAHVAPGGQEMQDPAL
jgi:hypothetical protein